ncbi:MAG: 1-deoxy-D-xylulose-5-phosphate reductoisomerase, partial [Candidatus Omnitrophica bacterium]|nr:1-deoxy-D-xylulose-5-phosphate reductoisomerase [Candidatus Omnitrophota bacterium]
YQPKYVAVNENGFRYLSGKKHLTKQKWINVQDGLDELVSKKQVDIVVIAMRGRLALEPFLAAVMAGKIVAPANKEALVIAGEILMREAKKNGATVIPIDSEQSAIFQCLQGHNKKELNKIILTASGGTLRDVPMKRFNTISVEDMLKHPTWKMGPKITVDSATLMNKGFELLEAKRLFHLKNHQIEVIIHPQSIIHSMVEFVDGSIIAQLSVPDMRIPIQYALTYPERWDVGLSSVNFNKMGHLTFQEPDYKKFPSLKLCIDVAEKEGTYPSVLNAADEEAVEAYLEGKIKFTQIFTIVEKVISRHTNQKKPKMNQILEADNWAREEARTLIGV